MAHRTLAGLKDGPERVALRQALAPEEFLMRFEERGERVIECSLDWKPELAVLDAELSGMSGLEACRYLKADARTRSVPVLMVTGSAGGPEAVSALEAGADDCIGRPWHARELLWRARGLIRRYLSAGSAEEPDLSVGRFRLDSEQGLFQIGPRTVRLTPREFALLEAFMRRPGRVLKRRMLLDMVWGFEAPVSPRVVDLTLLRLRRKMGADGRHIETVAGFGYRLVEAAAPPPPRGRRLPRRSPRPA